MRVTYVANYPSYHCVDVFNSMAEIPSIDLHVFYLRALPPGRQWTALRPIRHPHTFVREWRIHRGFYLNPGLSAQVRQVQPEKLVITQYASVGMQLLMFNWSWRRRPWIFWSEAPGVAYNEMPPVRSLWLRKVLRPMALFPVRHWPEQVWGVGETTTALYRQLLRRPCTNVPYCFDQSTFQAIERSTTAPGQVKLLFIGKLTYRKGLDVLLDSLEIVVRDREDFRLTICGDGPERNRLATVSERLRPRIDFLGFKEIAELPAVYAACDALVFPTRYDGWGLPVIEAMAAGMPVIATRAAVSAEEAIQDGVNGYRCAPQDPTAMAAAIQRLLDQKDQLRDMGQAGRTLAGRFNAKASARQMASLLLDGPTNGTEL